MKKLKVKKMRSFLVKRNHTVRTMEVLADLGIEKYDHRILWAASSDEAGKNESTWQFDVRLNDEELGKLMHDLKEYKVEVLAYLWTK